MARSGFYLLNKFRYPKLSLKSSGRALLNSGNNYGQSRIFNPPEDKADLFLDGGTVLNVYSGELLRTNIAVKKERELTQFLSKRGHPFHDPLYTFGFLPNDFLPEVRINYRGVVDIRKNKVLWPRRDLV